MSKPQASDPPFWVAWNQAIASIRVRLGRHLVTVLGIALGIAFFASVATMRTAPGQRDAFEAQRLQWLALTSLLMCLVGVTNSMLMSVTERYREIGTIKCLGASDSFIVKVFFLEALVLGAAGAFSGSILGSVFAALSLLFSGSAPSFVACLAVVAQSTALGLAMTIIAAIAPAVQAARMPAAAALRVEV